MYDIDAEMLDDDRYHLLDIHGVEFHVAGQHLDRLLAWHLGIVLHLLDETIETLVGRVVLQHIHDEPLLNGLPHGVFVERGIARSSRLVKKRFGLELRGSREGKKAEIRLAFPFQGIAEDLRLGLFGQVVVFLVGKLCCHC